MSMNQALVVTALVALAGCGGARSGKTLAKGFAPTTLARGFAKLETLGQFALAYQIELSEKYIVSVELTTEFNLVVRDPQGRLLRKQFLDTPTYDINALVIQGELAFVASSAGWVRSYALRSGKKVGQWHMGSGATALALSQDRKYLLIGTETGVMCLRRLSDGAQLQCVAAHAERIGAIDIAGDRIASASWGGELSLWRLPSLRREHKLPKRASIADVAWAPDGSLLAVARNQRPPKRTPADAKNEERSWQLGSNLIELWTVKDTGLGPSPARQLKGHRSIITSLAWLGPNLLSGSWDRSLRLWSDKKQLAVTKRFEHLVRDVATRPKGGWFAAAVWAPVRDSAAIVLGQLFY